MTEVADLDKHRRQARLFGRKVDADVAWAIRHVRENAEVCSLVNGAEDETTQEDRRLETVLLRLAREAGYDTASIDHEKPLGY
ncbi:MAG: hypothetical protein AAGK00_18780 [Pseudomonadota bacterium]